MDEAITTTEPQEQAQQTNPTIDNSSDIRKEFEEKIKALEEENKSLKIQKSQSQSTADKVFEKHKEEENKENSFEKRETKAIDESTRIVNNLKESHSKKILEVFETEYKSLQDKGISLQTRLESSKNEAVKYWLKENESKLFTDEEKRAYVDIQNGGKEGFKLLWNVLEREIEQKKQSIDKERDLINKIKDPKTNMDKYESTFFRDIKRVKKYDGGAYVTN